MASQDDTAQSDVSKMKAESDGSFKRAPSSFRNVIEKGGKFEPEKGRYYLYAAYSCPWATRTLIVRKLKGLEDIIAVVAVSPRSGEHGWPFASVDPFPGADHDPLYDAKHVKDLYFKADPEYSGRFTVPVLWDTKYQTIVNNESAEIIRIFNEAFNEFLPPEKAKIDLYPPEHRKEIDEINDFVYPSFNNGVYRAGFARAQEPYEQAVHEVFDALDKLEQILDGKEYFVGNRLTEVDVRVFVTAIRFDPVYYSHFKCNFRMIRGGYPAINKWMKNLYWNNDAFKSSTNFEHIKTSYYWSQSFVNGTRVIPVGPIPYIESL